MGQQRLDEHEAHALGAHVARQRQLGLGGQRGVGRAHAQSLELTAWIRCFAEKSPHKPCFVAAYGGFSETLETYNRVYRSSIKITSLPGVPLTNMIRRRSRCGIRTRK